MQELNGMETDKKQLWDIDNIHIDRQKPISEKKNSFVEDTEGNTSAHLNEGYVVRNYFSQEKYTATDAFKHYLRQIAELKY